MKLLNKIIEIKKVILEKALIINYKKIDKLPKIKAGYVDIETVLKRYENSLKEVSVKALLKDLSIFDNFYFLEQECGEYVKQLPKKFKLLDIGCGSGIYSKVFKRKASPFSGCQYIGTEIDERFTSLSKKHLPKDDFIVSLAEKIDLGSNSIDFIFCSSTLHYTLNDWKKSLTELERVSKKYIAITRFPVTKYNDTFYVHQTVKGLYGTENHFFIVINRKELENHFEKLGLKILKRDYSSQEYSIESVDEKIILIQYLLEKKNI